MKDITHNPNAKPQPKNKDEEVQYHHGRGAQINTKNKLKEPTHELSDYSLI